MCPESAFSGQINRLPAGYSEDVPGSSHCLRDYGSRYTFFVYKGSIYLIHSNLISTVIAVLVAVVVYALVMIVTHGVTEEELYLFP